MFPTHNFTFLSMLHERFRHLLPVSSSIPKAREKIGPPTIFGVVWEGGTLDGNIYGVPIIGNTLHLF